jgi:bacillithiol biosynthesis deacetylase BshB1
VNRRIWTALSIGGDCMRILVFGPHPDDAEIGAGGLLALAVRQGHEAMIVDLTRGELASNGSPDERAEEAAAAANILGVRRVTLGLPDQGLADTPEQAIELARVTREFRPDLVLIPHREDRHADHRAAADLCARGVALASLARHPALKGASHRVARVRSYLIHSAVVPATVVDISAVWEIKMRALEAYGSQFGSPGSSAATPLNSGEFVRFVAARDGYFGSLAGVARAEGFLACGIRLVSRLDEL